MANRFRVLRLISKGGMGEVYEAEDLELHETIAIKTILPDIAGNPAAIEQFKREIQLARKVTHLNVCRIFDLVYELRPSCPIAFLTMELLNGVTLSAYIEKRGTLTLEETLGFARQMAEGLNAAHQAGVIHQDFKSSNVMIVTEEDGAHRAVITDFGVAHNLRQAGSATGKIVGTPAYMAPEQIEGRPASPATDIYALGVVLYESVTGHLPYTAQTREELQQKKLHDSPVLPTKYIPDLPIQWERTILRCLSKEPEQRFSSAPEVIVALEPRRSRWKILVAAAAILILVASLGAYQWRKSFLAHGEPTVAVIGFQNNTGDSTYDWLSTELSETLAADLGDSVGLHMTATDEVAQLRTELSVPPNQSMERENLANVRQALGANYLLMGSYTVVKGSPEETLNLDLHIEDANGNRPVSFHQSGPAKEYGRLVSEAAAEIRQKLGTARLPDTDTAHMRNIYPSDSNARRLYFEALDKLRSYDAPTALSLLKQASEVEPDNTVIHSALADTWSQLKHDHEAAEEARKAAELAGQTSLPFEYVVLAQGRAEEMNKNWDAAIKDYGLLFPHYKHLNYGLQLAQVQMEGGHGKEALDTLGELATLPPPIGSDPRIDIARARVYAAEGDFASELTSAQAALREATRRNARLMQANAQLELYWAHRNLGHVDEAYAACNEAQNLFSAFGDTVSAAVALNDLATWLTDRGRYAEAKQLYDRVIQVNQKAGAGKDLAGACVNAAQVLDFMGKPDDAEEYIRRALAAAIPIGDKYNETLARILRGDILAKQGHASEAEQEIQHALTLARETNNVSTEAIALSNLAQVQSETDTQRSLATYRVVLRMRREKGDQPAIATCLMNMGNVFFRSGNLAAGQENYQEALGIDTQLKNKIGIAQDLASLAEVDLERGNLHDAQDKSLQAIKDFRENQDPDNEAVATSVLVRVLIAKKEIPDAAPHVRRIQEIASKDPETGFDGRLSIAEYLGASEKRDEAIQLLVPLPSEAKNAGMNFISLKARLELVRLKIGLRPSAELRRELSSIRSEARQAGFGLLVQQVKMLSI